MPGVIETIAVFVGGLGFSAGLGVTATNLLIYGVSGALTTGLYSAISFLATSLLTPAAKQQQSTRPEDVQQSIKQATAPRYRHYGKVKVSGPWAFAETNQGNFYKVISLGYGPFSSIEEFWVDDSLVTLDYNGYVFGGKFNELTTAEKPIIKYRLGETAETNYAELTSIFPQWTVNHKGNGVATLFATQQALPQAKINKIYPSYANTTYSVVTKAAKVLNPLTNILEWSDNSAAIIKDFLIHPDGMRLPPSLVNTPQAAAGFVVFFNKAATPYNLKAGGAEPRYRTWGSYTLTERPGDVLFRLMASCDARLKLTQDGGITAEAGDWQEPTATIDETMILAFSDVGRGKDILNTANTIKATFTDPSAGYKTAEADAWIDETDVVERGEIVQDLELTMSPSHSQARRLMKIQSYRSNPNWKGTFVCNLKALSAFNERFINLKYDALDINETFEILNYDFNISTNNILQSVSIQVQSMPAEAYSWDAATEEGTAPISNEVIINNEIPLPSNFDVTQQRINGVPYAVLTFDASPSLSLTVQARGKPVSSATWLPIGISPNATQTLSFAMSDGQDYEFQLRFVTLTTREGAWTPSITITATADITPPSIVTNVTTIGGGGQAIINWKTPNSANFIRSVVKRGATNIEASSVELSASPFYGPANTDTSYINSGLAAGTYYYWVYASNSSGILSSGVATGAVAVT